MRFIMYLLFIAFIRRWILCQNLSDIFVSQVCLNYKLLVIFFFHVIQKYCFSLNFCFYLFFLPTGIFSLTSWRNTFNDQIDCNVVVVVVVVVSLLVNDIELHSMILFQILLFLPFMLLILINNIWCLFPGKR